ncbi:ribosome assembly protein [Ceratobasidium sp. AG-Ba]|nr:ribosome assembly protein [Ceratobasidium sp. AG-Ba]
MPPAKPATAPARKRNRKRKRRAASTSSSSSSSSSSSDDESPQLITRPAPTYVQVAIQVDKSKSDSGSVLTSSSSSSSSNSDSEGSAKSSVPPTKHTKQPRSRSPSPPSTAIPPFTPAPGTERDQELRTRFRKFWMASIADGFRDDLEELHKEPNLTESRLGLLIDSLASGADVFMAGGPSSSNANHGLESASGANEMEIVLNGTT